MTPALLLAIALSAQPADPAGAPFAMRVQAAALDSRCGLLTPAERAALDAGLNQSRRERLESGVDAADLDGWEASLRERADALDCRSEQAHAVAADIGDAYRAWLNAPTAEYRGDHRSWRADRRTGGPSRWRVRQDAQGAAFGLEDARGGRVALAGRGEKTPASAVLVLRDGAKAARPMDSTAGGLVEPFGGDPVAAWGPPPNAQTRWWANARLDPADAASLAPDGLAPAYGFEFPRQALDALARLEPRESARIDLLAADGRRIGRVWIEAGALGPALAFADAARFETN